MLLFISSLFYFCTYFCDGAADRDTKYGRRLVIAAVLCSKVQGSKYRFTHTQTNWMWVAILSRHDTFAQHNIHVHTGQQLRYNKTLSLNPRVAPVVAICKLLKF